LGQFLLHKEVVEDVMSEGFKVWQCLSCGYIYDEEEGAPDDGLPPGTRWADVSDDWQCPLCGATKADFEMVEMD